MSYFRGSGGARPSKAMSWLTAVVGVGMVVCVVLFFIAPVLAVACFVGLWIVTVLGIVGYHIKNATSDKGVPHTRFDFQAEISEQPRGGDFDTRLRDLQKLRDEGLVTEEEYHRKRADILNEDW